MPSKKGQRKTFAVAVIIAILTRKSQKHADSKRPVDMADVAKVNEHLFPHSGKCWGPLVRLIVLNRSRPEILRQLMRRPSLKNAGMLQASPERLQKLFRNRVSLVSTGR